MSRKNLSLKSPFKDGKIDNRQKNTTIIYKINHYCNCSVNNVIQVTLVQRDEIFTVLSLSKKSFGA